MTDRKKEAEAIELDRLLSLGESRMHRRRPLKAASGQGSVASLHVFGSGDAALEIAESVDHSAAVLAIVQAAFHLLVDPPPEPPQTAA